MRTEDSRNRRPAQVPEGDRGRHWRPRSFRALSEDATAQEAIRRLQQATDAEMVFYIYVTDKDDRLVGVLSLRQLLTVPPATPLKNIMTRDLIQCRRGHGSGKKSRVRWRAITCWRFRS